MEKIINFALQRRLVIVVLTILVIVAGYFSYTRLPVDAFPDVSPNLVQVFTTTEGLAPEEVEKYVTYPVEVAMAGLPGVTKVRSVSNFGLSVVNIYFEDGLDIYFCRQVVSERLQEAREQIPEGFGDPGMGPISTGMGLVLFYYLDDETGTHSLEELRSIQDWIIKFNLQTVSGVTEVLGIGGNEKQFHVNVDPANLLRYNLTLHDVIERIKANNLNVGAQFIEKNAEEQIVRSIGLATGIDDLNNIVVKSEDGRPVYLQDVAVVKNGGAIRRGLQTRNGEGEVVAGMVIKLFGSNASSVIQRVEDKIKEINAILPDGVHIVPYYQQKDIVEASVKTVLGALIQGIVLVAMVLLVFMGGFRPSAVVALSIPFSVMFAVIAMKQLGMSANLMSLGGLAIAIGMMVDGTIVMVENIDRMLREADPDDSRMTIVASACAEVGKPIIFAIAIIIIVFLPLFTLQGVEGKTFKPLAYTVALAMLGSLVFAIFQAPVFGQLLMRRPKQQPGTMTAREPLLVRLIHRVYQPVVKLFVHRRWMAVIFSVFLLVAGGWVYSRLGSEFTPKLREGTIVAADVQVDQVSGVPQLLIKPDRNAIARYGLNISDVQEVISAAVGGADAGAVFEGVRQFDIVVRYIPGARNNIDAIRKILIQTPDGVRVPLDQLAALEEIVGPRQVTRENNQRFITIQCNVQGRDIGSFVEEAQSKIDTQVNLPTGYLTTWGGEFRLQQEANKRLAVVVPITLGIIALLLYGSFNSIMNTLLILLNIPLALVGGIIALWLTGQNLSVPSSVGFIALFGIALENGMVLVTYLNQLLRDGVSIDEASIKGACLRLRPVLMTALTTALGLIPLLFSSGTGSEVQRPLATVVTGGLVTSTILTLLVIPALYKWFSINVEKEV